MSARRRILLRNMIAFAVLLLPAVVLGTPVYSAAPVTAVAVTTTADIVDGAVSSLTALSDNPGDDSSISLREALFAAEATPAGPVLRITFSLVASDPGYDQATGTWRIREKMCHRLSTGATTSRMTITATRSVSP